MKTEATASIWARRAISIPSYAALFSVALMTALPALLLAAAVDIATGRIAVMPRCRALAFFVHYLACEVIGVTVAFALWLTSLGGRVGGQARYQEQNRALQRGFTNALFRGATTLFSMKVEVEAEDSLTNGPLLLLVRHSSTADTVLAAALIANPRKLALRYVMKRQLLWDPCLDIVGRRLLNAFVDRRSKDDVRVVAELAHDLAAHEGVLIYPEGTRFSAEKLRASIVALEAHPELAAIASSYRVVLPPKLGGTLALLDAAPGVDVVFVEHHGLEGASTFARFWSGALVHQTIRVRIRRISAATIPRVGRDRWLFERWREVDEWVERAAATSARASRA